MNNKDKSRMEANLAALSGSAEDTAALIANAAETKRQRDMLLEACKAGCLIKGASQHNYQPHYAFGYNDGLMACRNILEAAIKDCEDK